jgi:hypothetical protein
MNGGRFRGSGRRRALPGRSVRIGHYLPDEHEKHALAHLAGMDVLPFPILEFLNTRSRCEQAAIFDMLHEDNRIRHEVFAIIAP